MSAIGTRRLSRRLSGGDTWLPSELSGLKVWYDADDLDTLYQDSAKTTPVAADGDPIGCWGDKSGNGDDVTQGTTSAKPLYKTGIKNGKAAVLFDGSNDRIFKNPYTLTQPYHVIAVAQANAAGFGDAKYRMLGVGYTGTTYFGKHATNDKYVLYAAGAGYLDDPTVILDTNWRVYHGFYNGANSWIRRDGTTEVEGAVGVGGITQLYVSCGNYWYGYICEWLIVGGTMTSAEITSLENYLNNKWACY
jgi:hypothetical protein